MSSDSNFFHHHKKRIVPAQTPERHRYIRRLGKHAKKGDFVAGGVANLPAGIADPEQFCRLLAQHERKNGGAYEHEISIPRMLSRDEYVQVGEQLALKLADRSPVIWGVHCPNSRKDGGKQPHVHALVYPRVPDGIPRVHAEDLFKRHDPKHPQRGGWKKRGGGDTRRAVIENLRAERRGACEVVNTFLQRAGAPFTVDHRSYAERGIAKDPGKHRGPCRTTVQSSAGRAGPPAISGPTEALD